MRKLLILMGVLLIIGIIGCNQKGNGQTEEKGSTFQNPVYEPVLADPSIVKGEDDYYYAYGTEDAWGDHSKPVLVPITRSKNLVDWEYMGPAFESKPMWKGAGSIWAPHATKYKGKYYLYYSLSIWGDSNPGIGVAVSENAQGPFKDKGKLFTSEEIGVENSIDPYFYTSEEGDPYLFWGSFHGIYGVKLSDNGLKTAGDKFKLAGDAFEAPYIIKREGFYYFFGSKGSCCEGENSSYHVAVGRSKSLTGPYLDKAGEDIKVSEGTTILRGQDDGLYVGPGHNAIVQDDSGTDWIVYHAINKDDPKLWTGATRRPLMIDPIIWKDGWPTVANQEPNTDVQEAPVFE